MDSASLKDCSLLSVFLLRNFIEVRSVWASIKGQRARFVGRSTKTAPEGRKNPSRGRQSTGRVKRKRQGLEGRQNHFVTEVPSTLRASGESRWPFRSLTAPADVLPGLRPCHRIDLANGNRQFTGDMPRARLIPSSSHGFGRKRTRGTPHYQRPTPHSSQE